MNFQRKNRTHLFDLLLDLELPPFVVRCWQQTGLLVASPCEFDWLAWTGIVEEVCEHVCGSLLVIAIDIIAPVTFVFVVFNTLITLNESHNDYEQAS